ncbi:hypothetical protein IG631_06319 [Alternaria alternata]|nr:hypothetical protein IG631_06319 [Alternaria alternata]
MTAATNCSARKAAHEIIRQRLAALRNALYAADLQQLAVSPDYLGAWSNCWHVKGSRNLLSLL